MATTTTKQKKASPTVQVTLSTFDLSDRPIFRVIREGKLKGFGDITGDDYRPNGATPLLDAMVEFMEHVRGKATKGTVQVGLLLDESGSMAFNTDAVIASVNEFVGSLRAVKKVDPKTAGKGFLVIATDGYENASTKHDYKAVAKQVAKCEKDGWVTIFLGAGIDAWSQGRQVGVSGHSAHAQTISTVNTPEGTRSAMKVTSAATAAYLADSATYLNSASKAPSASITEDGKQVNANIAQFGGDIIAPTGAYDPADAVKTATSRLSE